MKQYCDHIIVVLIFAVLSVIFSAIFIKTGGMVLTSDSSFHISRVEEIYQNLREGKVFTFTAAHTFSNSGVGNFMFYPTLFLYPWALLMFIFNPITSFYLWYGLFLFLTMFVAYYSMLRYSSSKIRSYIFALVYSLAAYHIHLGSWNYVLGEFTAYTFIPLVFLGIYNVLFGNSKEWKILGIGMALLMYSHLLSVYITSVILAIITIVSIIYRKGIAKERVVSLIKSALLTVVLVMPQLTLFITDYIGSNLAAPNKGFYWSMSVMELIEPSINNTSNINRSVGIVILIAAFIGWYFIKNNTKEKTVYIIGVLLLCLPTKLVPWESLANTFLINIIGQIQFTYRFNMYSSFFLAVTFSLILQRCLNNIDKVNYTRFLVIISITFLMVIDYTGMVADTITRVQTNTSFLTKNKNKPIEIAKDVYVNNKNWQNIFSYLVLYGETDYYPKKSFDNNNIAYNKNAQTIVQHTTYLNSKKVSSELSSAFANGIIYTVNCKKKGTLDLPVIKYNHTDVVVNGNLVDSKRSDRGTVQVMVPKGINRLVVKYRPSSFFYITFFIAIITWIIIIFMAVFARMKNGFAIKVG